MCRGNDEPSPSLRNEEERKRRGRGEGEGEGGREGERRERKGKRESGREGQRNTQRRWKEIRWKKFIMVNVTILCVVVHIGYYSHVYLVKIGKKALKQFFPNTCCRFLLTPR